jgi:hypothetical protein
LPILAAETSRADDERLRHYSYQWVAKRSGGFRLLEIPKSRLRALQRRLLHELIEYVPPHEAAHGFRSRHSCVTNAEQHVGVRSSSGWICRIFSSVSARCELPHFFRALGYPEGAGQDINRLVHQPGTFTGARCEGTCEI